MFDPVQIQGRPTPRLFVTSGMRVPEVESMGSISVALADGVYLNVIVDGGGFGPDSAALGVGLSSGTYGLAIVPGGTFGPDEVSVSVGLPSGVYGLVIVPGGTFGPDESYLSVSLESGVYEYVTVPLSVEPQPAAISVALASGEYAPV